MAGNVLEWVSDWYQWDYYNESPYINPQGPINGYTKVLRGGSWVNGNTSDSWDVSTYIRYYWIDPSEKLTDQGFRCARTP